MLKTCAYKIGNRLILKLSLFSKKVIIKKSEYSLKEKRRISKQSEAKSWLTRPLLGTATVLRVKEESSVLCIAWKMRLFSLKKKRDRGWHTFMCRIITLSQCFFIFFSFDQGNRKSIIQRKLSLRFPLGHLIRA